MTDHECKDYHESVYDLSSADIGSILRINIIRTPLDEYDPGKAKPCPVRRFVDGEQIPMINVCRECGCLVTIVTSLMPLSKEDGGVTRNWD